VQSIAGELLLAGEPYAATLLTLKEYLS